MAGSDISDLARIRSGEEGLAYEARMDRILHALREVPAPTVAMIEGLAVGGGLNIAAACDLRTAEELAPTGLFAHPGARGDDLIRLVYGSADPAEGTAAFLEGWCPSGCGKSTLLRMIAGLEEVTRGEIRIDRRLVNDLHPKDRDIAMVFQNYALYPHMSVEGNMDFPLRLRGMARQPRHERIEGAAGILNIGALLSRLPGNLSGGQRQRVATGRAIVRSPKVFLFDEPLSNLDAKLRVQMRGEIKSLQSRLATIVYVTHYQVEAMTMADRIVVMNGGRVEQIGRPLDLYDRPANRFVAGFIGSPSMNFLQGVLRPDGRDVFVPEDGIAPPLPPVLAAHARGPALYGVRLEHVRPDPDGLELQVRIVEPTDPEVQVVGDLGQQPFVAVFRDRVLPRPGDTVRLLTDRERVAIFDATTERAIGTPAG